MDTNNIIRSAYPNKESHGKPHDALYKNKEIS